MKYILLFSGLLFLKESKSQSIRNAEMNTDIQSFAYSMFNDTRQIKDPRALVLFYKAYIINGRNVVGSPFLYEDWLQGKIETTDGRIFEGYKLKYNAFHQTLFFKTPTDSLEVNESVKSFNLLSTYNNEVKNLYFDYFDKVPKLNTPVYLEVLYDGDKGKLYKLNTKTVTPTSSNLPNNSENLVFDLKYHIFYFTKKGNKLLLIKYDFSNLEDVLKPSPAALAILKTMKKDFKEEASLINYVKVGEQE